MYARSPPDRSLAIVATWRSTVPKALSSIGLCVLDHSSRTSSRVRSRSDHSESIFTTPRCRFAPMLTSAIRLMPVFSRGSFEALHPVLCFSRCALRFPRLINPGYTDGRTMWVATSLGDGLQHTDSAPFKGLDVATIERVVTSRPGSLRRRRSSVRTTLALTIPYPLSKLSAAVGPGPPWEMPHRHRLRGRTR